MSLLQPNLAYTFDYLITFGLPYVIEVTQYTDTRHLFLLPSLLNSYLFHAILAGDPARQSIILERYIVCEF